MATPAAFPATFAALRRVLKPYEKSFTVIADEPGRYYLESRTAKTTSGAAIGFGGVEIMKNYVSFHLMPVYASPRLLKTVSPSLLKRMQGKSCFNFTEVAPEHVKELTALTKKGFAGFRKKFA
jgi:hypothetical protein